MKICKHTGENKAPDFRVDDRGTLWYKNRTCVPEGGDFRQTIMDEAHNSAYSIHQDVHGLKTEVLVEWDESRHCTVRRPLWHLSENQSRTPETRRTVAAFTNPGMEMGRDRHGFRSRVAKDSEGT
jgi:hypothetical protein